MKVLKRITLLALFFLTLFVSVIVPANVSATNSYSNGAATYRVKEVTDERDLGYGVKFHREKSTLSTEKSGYTNSITLGHEYEQQVSVLEIDPSEDLQLVPYAFLEGSSWVATTVKKAAAQYELTHPGYRVIAAVNGDYFKINEDCKASTGVTIGQGEFYKTITNHGGNSIAIKNSGDGKQLFTTHINSSTPFLAIYDENDNIIKEIKIDKVNAEPADGEIALYYAQRTKAFTKGFEAPKVKDAYYVRRGTYAVTSIKDSFYGVGKITEFVSSEIEITEGQFAIKSNNAEITELLGTDVKIRCQYEFTDSSLEGIDNFIGYPFTIIENGTVMNHDQYRHPRTIIGQRENGEIVLAVVDGRQTSKGMYGASTAEMAAIMGYYDCVDAWNLDGGGSSTMIIRKQFGWDFVGTFEKQEDNWHISNSPSDGSERSDGNHLLVVVKVPEVEISYKEITTDLITLNVALLTDVEKYKELYVLVNGEYYPVVNNEITVDGLKKNTIYQFEVFSKVDGQMLDLMTLERFKTSKPEPTSVLVRLDIYEKGGQEYVMVRYKLDANDAVKTIILVADEEYLTAGETTLIEKKQAFYDALTNAKIEIKYNVNDLFEDEILILEKYDLEFTISYIFDELENTVNSLVSDIFQ